MLLILSQQRTVQDMAKEDGSQVHTDASGNPILKDIGLYLRGVFRKQLDVSPPPQGPLPSAWFYGP